MSAEQHWDSAYTDKGVNERSWSESGDSDALIEFEFAQLGSDAAVIDVGGGASTFAKSLQIRGYKNLAVLDVSQVALREAQESFGNRAAEVEWIVSNILNWEPTRSYAYWNDRAVFHFLTKSEDQQKYVEKVSQATEAGSHIVIATFSPEGPESCSGLPVQRWTQEVLASLFSDTCSLLRSGKRDHLTPWGSTQSFSWVHLIRN